MKQLKRPIFTKQTSITLEGYLAGLVGVDLNTVMMAGEDLVRNVMLLSIHDLPGWIKSGDRFELRMSKDDKRLLKAYFRKLRLGKYENPDLSEEIQSWREKRIQRANRLGRQQLVNMMKRKRVRNPIDSFDQGYNQAIKDLMTEAKRFT